MGKGETREILLEAGKRIFLAQGYNHAGIESILQAAGVPKGSFYHYFDSKEGFGLAVLDRFAAGQNANLDRYLCEPGYTPLQRLRRFAEAMCERLETQQCRNGCLVGNLSLEMAEQSEAFRSRLDAICNAWVARYAECLKAAQEAGEIAPDLDVGELSEFWLNSWQGAVLRAKTIRNTAPLKTFLKVMFETVLKT